MKEPTTPELVQRLYELSITGGLDSEQAELVAAASARLERLNAKLLELDSWKKIALMKDPMNL